LLWKDIIQSILSKGARGKSHFWKTVEVKMELVNLRARVQLSDGAHAKFWTDVWFGEMSISHMYPQLAALVVDPALTVQEVWEAGSSIRYQVRFKKTPHFQSTD
jgi:hypothetical protein